MVKFRFIRESLDESMETAIEIETLDDPRLVEKISYAKFPLRASYQGYDERIDWDTWFILDANGSCCGHSNGWVPSTREELEWERYYDALADEYEERERGKEKVNKMYAEYIKEK